MIADPNAIVPDPAKKQRATRKAKKDEVVKLDAVPVQAAAQPIVPSKYESESTEALVGFVKEFNDELDKHAAVLRDRAKRALYASWNLGEVLKELFRRRTPDERKAKTWKNYLADLGVGWTRGYYSKRLAELSTYENLENYENLQQALKGTGIIKVKEPLEPKEDREPADSKTAEPVQPVASAPPIEVTGNIVPAAEVLDVTPPIGDDPEILAAYNHRALAQVRTVLKGITYLEGESVELLDEIGDLVDELRASISNVAPTA